MPCPASILKSYIDWVYQVINTQYDALDTESHMFHVLKISLSVRTTIYELFAREMADNC